MLLMVWTSTSCFVMLMMIPMIKMLIIVIMIFSNLTARIITIIMPARWCRGDRFMIWRCVTTTLCASC